MGIPPNPERNEKLYQCWLKGNTIEEAAEKTGVPISTAGYYYRKFDRYEEKGSPIPRGVQASTESSFLEFAERKAISDKVEALEKEGKYSEARESDFALQREKEDRVDSVRHRFGKNTSLREKGKEGSGDSRKRRDILRGLGKGKPRSFDRRTGFVHA